MSTDSSSNHLYTMNAVLSLAYNLESYPSHLFEAGYRISRIEPKLNVRIPKYTNSKTVEPDIIFISNKRALIAECKSGEYSIGSNIKNYSYVSIIQLAEKGIDIPAADLEIDIGIFGNKNMDVLKDKLKEEGIRYPQVVIDDIVQKKYGDDFKDPLLRDKFNEPVDVISPPLTIVKFSKDSPFKVIAPYVLNTLMAWTVSGDGKKEFRPYELAEEVVGDIWSNFDEEGRRDLTHKIKDFLRYCKTHQLKDYLSNNGEVWTIAIKTHWKSRKKFSRDSAGLISGFNQKTLFDKKFKSQTTGKEGQ